MFGYRHFLQALNSGDYLTSETIITNLLTDKPSSFKYLEGYLMLLEKSFDQLPVLKQEEKLETYQNYSNKFLTYGILTKVRMTQLKEFESRILKLKEKYQLNRLENEKAQVTNSKKTNEETLAFLQLELSKLDEALTEREFDDILDEVKRGEKRLQVSSLDESEKELYDSLIDKYASKIASRTKDFENQTLTKYNTECLDSLSSLLKTFRKSHRKFVKNFELLKPLLVSNMFSYDTSKLFLETNEYYEYCYTYIFNRLNYDEKYLMASLALSTIKK